MDFAILDFIQSHIRCEFLDMIMPGITHLGEAGILWIIIAVILLFTKKYRRAGIVMLLAMGTGYLITDHALKPLIARPRPFIQRDIAMLISPPSGYSFPSGHTATSFCAALCLTFANKKFALPAYVVAVLIAFSRMYLYCHFPTDVLGGIVMGTVYALVANVIAKKIFKKKNGFEV